MRKLLITVLSCILLLATVCFFGCGCNKSNWTAPEFNDKNVTVTDGGFVAKTSNYVLFINGVADHTENNTYKNPVKGSLMVISNSDLSNGKYENAKILVPKLFAATDYNAGIFVYDDYVYFGTPSTEKNSSGKIANDKMVIAKAKIDGTEEPKALITLPSLSCEYRVVKNGNTVYVVFYDTNETALKVLNTANGSVSVIAKTNEKTNVGNGEYLSLDSYKFVDNAGLNDAVVVFTAKVYTGKYYEEEANKSGYSRLTAPYNYIYSYKAGDGAVDNVFLGKKILDSNEKDYTFTLNLVKSGYLFFNKAEKNNADKKTYCAMDLKTNEVKEIINESAIAETSLIIDLENVYLLENDYLVKKSLIGDKRDSKENIVNKGNISTILFLDGNDIYYINTSSELVKKDILDENAKEIRISNGAINNSWYAPELITVNENKFVFFTDPTTAGSDYVFVAKVSGDFEKEDTDEDGEDDLFYFNNKLIGKVREQDVAKDFISEVNKLGSIIKFTEGEDGKLFNENLSNAKKYYAELTDSQKKGIDGDISAKYENALNAEKLANAYYKLKGVQKYDKSNEADYREKYKEAKAVRDELVKKDKDGAVYYNARDLLEEELKYYYQEANKYFAE